MLTNEKRAEYISRLSELCGFKVPIDGLLTAALGRKEINVIQFNKNVNPDEGESLLFSVERKYGVEAMSIFDLLTRSGEC